jgi:hypothetical protein
MIRYQLICGAAGPAEAKPASRKTARSGASASPARKTPAGCGHQFESWFQNSAAYDSLLERGQITCPACGSGRVEKALMAPNVKTTKGKEKSVTRQDAEAASAPGAATPTPGPVAVAGAPQALAALTPEQRTFVDAMRRVRAHVLANSEDVGKKFVEEARKIHHEETELRSIHGEASLEEAKALAEEGIDIFPIPVLPDDRN